MTVTGPEPGAGATGASLSGRRLGEFVVHERLGQGGSGVVYRATQPALGREAVIKVLTRRRDSDEATVARFLREARVASRLDHPYAAHIYAFGAEQDGLLWIAMELVRGTPLDQLLRGQGRVSPDRLVPLLERIAEVVHTAHEQGIIHRDLKPANVMVLSRAGRYLPKLLDFGIARLLEAPESPPRAQLEHEVWSVGAPLTDSGLLGSPAYMAPEQWADPTRCDARTDQYALGVLAFECLSGRLPFEARSLSEMAAAHARAQVPPLGRGWPGDIDQVLARALAKRPEDRFESVLALATSLRRALVGLDLATTELSRLPAALEEALLMHAPQPIAETIAALQGARNPIEAWEQLERTVGVCARLVAVCALACRASVGPDAGVSPRERELLAGLRGPAPGPRAWVALAEELCRTFVGRAAACPLPELIELVFDTDGHEHAPFAPLLELTARAGGAGGDDEARTLARLLADAVGELGRLLRRIVWLSDYTLIVARDDHAETWMGVRRTPRRRVESPPDLPRPAAGVVGLLSPGGSVALELSPLVQVGVPSPGQPEELFWIDGAGRRGARLKALPGGLERHDPDLWRWLEGHGLPTAEQSVERERTDRPPYRGLSSFGAEDAGLFFGREHEVEAFVNRLQLQPLISVVGPSGAGKSSFVLAGVAPSLPPAWRTVVVRPGASPWEALRVRLAKESIDAGDGRDADALGERLTANARQTGRPVLLVVDQLEELFTLCADGEERQRYARSIVNAARDAAAPIRVVLTLRDDFLLRAEELAPFRERIGLGVQLLTTPPPEELERILVEPARRAGLDFEDERLPQEMVAAVAGQPGALPLLSFTAAKLWELRDRQYQQLTRRAYVALGGVGGALAQHAEETLAGLDAEQRQLVREIFRQLVTSEGTRAVLSRAEALQILGGTAAAESVIETLVRARLLSASEGEAEQDRVEIVHEALLVAWPRVVEWRRQDAESARLRDQLRAAARQWEERGRPSGMLWRDDVLVEYQVWRRRYAGALTSSEERFAAASVTASLGERRRRRLALAGVIAMLCVGVVLLVLQNRETARERSLAQASSSRAQAQLAANYFEQARQANLDGDQPRALLYLAEACELGAGGAGFELLTGRVAGSLSTQRASLSHGGWVKSAQLSADGERALTASADGSARLWDARTARLVASLPHQDGVVLVARFSPDGKLIASAGKEAVVRVWQGDSGTPVAALEGHTDGIWDVRFSPSGDRILSASADGTARIWDTATARQLHVLGGHQGAVQRAIFSPNGELVVTAGRDRTARVYRAGSGELLHTLAGHPGGVRPIDVSPDGTRVVTAGGGGAVFVWELASGRRLKELVGHRDFVTSVGWYAGGERIFTTSSDGSLRLWDAGSGEALRVLEAHVGGVFDGWLSADGRQIITSGIDGTAKIWDAGSGEMLQRLRGHRDTVVWVDLSRDGRTLLTASHDGTARLWRFEPDGGMLQLDGAPARVARARARRDGGGVVAVTLDHELVAWSVSGELEARVRPGFEIDGLAISATGERALLLTGGEVAIFSMRERRELDRIRATGTRLTLLAADREARVIVAAAEDGRGWIWTEEPSGGGRRLVELERPPAPLVELDIDPDARRVVGFTARGQVALVWDARTGRRLGELRGHSGDLISATFDESGHRVITASIDRSARVWNVDELELVALLEVGAPVTAALRLGGQGIVAVAGDDGRIRLFDERSGQALDAVLAHPEQLIGLSASGDGTTMISYGDEDPWVVRLWKFPVIAYSCTEMRWLARCRAGLGLVDGRAQPVEDACDP